VWRDRRIRRSEETCFLSLNPVGSFCAARALNREMQKERKGKVLPARGSLPRKRGYGEYATQQKENEMGHSQELRHAG